MEKKHRQIADCFSRQIRSMATSEDTEVMDIFWVVDRLLKPEPKNRLPNQPCRYKNMEKLGLG